MVKKDVDSFEGIIFRHIVTDDWSMDQLHFHDFFEINISISSGNKFYCNNTLHITEPGDIYLFNDHDLHKNIIRKGIKYERYLIFFQKKDILELPKMDIDLLELFFLDRCHFRNKIKLNKDQFLHLSHFLNETIFMLNKTVYGYKTLGRSKLVELLIMINSFYHNNIGDVKTYNQSTNHISKRVETIINYINNNIERELNLDLLANEVHINKYYLGELFKRETGFTIHQFIINKRILKAQKLLQSGYNVTEVTESVGYSNESHFIRTFKKLVGITPKQYAISHRIDL